MKTLRLALALSLLVAPTFAASIGSYATGSSPLGNVNSAMNYGGVSSTPTITLGTNPTFTLAPAGIWENPPANSTWIGYAPNAGPLSGFDPPVGYYTFTTQFMPGGSYTGSITVDADDTTEVFLDGAVVVPFGVLGGDGHCADGTPNCTLTDTINIAGNASLQTLTFLVEQAGQEGLTDDPSGVAFDGTFTVSTVPEPNTLAMLGSGLLALGGVLRRKLQWK